MGRCRWGWGGRGYENRAEQIDWGGGGGGWDK